MPRLLALAVLVALPALTAGCSRSPTASEPPRRHDGDAVATTPLPFAMSSKPYTKPSPEELRVRLDPLTYEVTQNGATEPSFRNRYFDNHQEGIYVDAVSGEPLFSSKDKFDSGTGWPSFSAPIAGSAVVSREDNSHGMERTEVRSRLADSHLGHLFNDGPGPTKQRYCINSAALRFVPKARLVAEGYGAYAAQFGVSGPKDAASGAKDAASGAKDVGSGVKNATQGASCASSLEDAYLAAGCFWGAEQILRNVPGVVTTEVGYMGGTTPSPTYNDVHLGTTGHAETVHVTFDPARLSFQQLLEDWFFRLHDPTTKDRQGNDRGTQYRSAIFVVSTVQEQQAHLAIAHAQSSGRWSNPIVTEVSKAGTFTPAEPEHQDYLVRQPGGYTCHFLRK